MAWALYCSNVSCGCCHMRTWHEPSAPSLTSLVGGIHADSFSSAVASSIRPPGANSDINHFHVLDAPLKNATNNGVRWGSSGAIFCIVSKTFVDSHGFPSIAPISYVAFWPTRNDESSMICCMWEWVLLCKGPSKHVGMLITRCLDYPHIKVCNGLGI